MGNMATPAWNVSGQYYETCNCDFVCLCVPSQLAVRPTKGDCQFAMAFQIERGSYGAVSLDGLGFIILGLSPEEMGKGNWSVGLVTDARATAEQRDAMTAIASGAAGGPLPSRSRHHLELPRPPDRARVDVSVPPRSPDVGRDGARPDDGGHGYDDGHAVEHGRHIFHVRDVGGDDGWNDDGIGGTSDAPLRGDATGARRTTHAACCVRLQRGLPARLDRVQRGRSAGAMG